MITRALHLALVTVCLCLGLPAQFVPDGFTVDNLFLTLTGPVGMDFLPDGRLLIVEHKTAAIKVFALGAIGTVGTVSGVNTSGDERGLLGIAVDPRFPADPYVYVNFTNLSPADVRVVRYELTGELDKPASVNLGVKNPYVVLDGIPDQTPLHNGGALRFGPDRMLTLGIGDDLGPCNSQRLGEFSGAVLRMSVFGLPTTGGGPPALSSLVPVGGNPFSGPNDIARLTFCYGLRNPFRHHVDPATGYLYIADVGEVAVEEMNEARGGENFGWPWEEGPLPFTTCQGTKPTDLVQPIGFYGREHIGGQSIISLGVYRNVFGGVMNFGNAYDGDAFYVDFYGGWVRRLKKVGTTWTTPPKVPGQPTDKDWALGFYNVVDAARGPDGALYVLNYSPGGLYRLRYTPKLPTIVAAPTAEVGKPYTVSCRRDPGDPTLLVLGPLLLPPFPLRGAFGVAEVFGFPFQWGNMDQAGRFDSTFTSIPETALGATFHFQCVVQRAGETYISTPHSVKVTS